MTTHTAMIGYAIGRAWWGTRYRDGGRTLRAQLAQGLERHRRTALGRKPYEHGRKSASKTGSNTSFAAICTIRSRTVGMPNGPFVPSAFGMYRRKTTVGRYVPLFSATPIASRKLSTPRCSTSAIVSESTPAAPLLLRARLHASSRTSLRPM